MSRCQRCEAECPEHADFCGQCGTRLRRHCGHCGAVNPAENRFCEQCGAVLRIEPRQASQREAERRHLCVMFCDLKGSTAISNRLELHAWHHLLRGYQDACYERIDAQQGHVTRFFGDGILSVFGYPNADEHHAERAVLAGLDIISSVQSLDRVWRPRIGQPLQVRVAVASGPTVVGGALIGQGPSEEDPVYGPAVHLAARLQDVTSPGSLLICDRTRALVRDLFLVEPRGPFDVKGFERPVHAFEVIRPLESAIRFDATRRTTTPVVGRDEQLTLMERLWTRAREGGAGAVLLIGGEPGIGKSRLTREFLDRQGRLQVRPYVYQCSPLHVNSPLFPVVSHLRRNARIQADDEPGVVAEKLGAILRGDVDTRVRAVETLGDLVGTGPHSATGDVPEQRREILDVIRHQIRTRAEEGPLLLVFEDAQWVDPTTRELLDRLVGEVERQPAMLIVTHRPEFQPPWADEPHVTRMTLPRLSVVDVERMIAGIPEAGLLAPRVRKAVTERTDGIPLFVEELVSMLCESAGGGDDALQLDIIPPTLQALLAERLDRMREVRRVLQVLSVTGREATYALLLRVCDVADQVLDRMLAKAVDAGLVYARGSGRWAVYRFKHALVRDAAYAGMLPPERTELHRRVAEALEEADSAPGGVAPEVVAYHFDRGAAPARAVHYYHEAGQRAARRSQNPEAVAHLTRALRLLRRMPETEERLERELEVLVARGPALITTKGPGRLAARRNYERALTLCERLDRSALHFAAYWGSLRIDESYASKLARVQELQRLGEELGDDGYVLQAHHRQWATLFHMARLDECDRNIEAGIALYEAGDYRDHGTRYAGHDPKVCAHGEAALSRWLAGDTRAAREHIEHALDWARTLEHAGSIAHALDIACMLSRYRRNAGAVASYAREMRSLAEDHGFPDHASKARLFLGWSGLAEHRQHGEIAALEAEMRFQERNNTPEDFPVFYESLAEAYALSGNLPAAMRACNRGLEVVERDDILYWKPELLRRRGEVQHSSGDEAGAQAGFREAFEVAATLGLRALGLRAADSAARLATGEGSRESGAALLARALGALVDEGACEEAPAARELLASLHGGRA